MMQAKAGVMAYLFEYHRLSGVGPSLMEVASKDVMLEVLSRAFSTPVQPSDLKFIRYRKVGKGVELEDMVGRLGGILTSVEPQDADPKALIAFLKKHGAKTFKAESLDESNQVGKTIIQQMGGSGAIRAMLGGSVVYLPKGVGIRWPNKQRSRGNYVEVILTPADLYDVTFYNMKGTMKYWHPDASKKQVKQYKGVMFDQLREIFYSQTGWVLSKPKIHKVPSSPGREARIDKAKAELLAKWKKAGLL